MPVPKGVRVGGRQKGTPNKATSAIKEVAREYGPSAIKKLAELGGLIEGTAGAESEAARVAAINTILDRGYGKAAQPHDGDGGGGPVKMVISWMK